MSCPRADVIVVGAGPVGLLAALALGKNGNSVILLEKNVSRPRQSRAIGITPPTLGMFKRLGIVETFMASGVPVTRGGGYSTGRKLCSVDLSGLSTDYPFILTIPQHRTESLLENAVTAQTNVLFLKGFEAQSFHISGEWCSVIGVEGIDRPFTVQGRFAFGCDGAKSAMRQNAGGRFLGRPYPHTFLMADYRDTTGWGNEARLYFTERGSVESFPLPEGCRRFVLRTPCFVKDNFSDFLAVEIPLRCGVHSDNEAVLWESAFGVQHFIASTFAAPRLFLCGDAAHIMSPIGGQNMNVGFADAELAAWLVEKVLEGKAKPGAASLVYDRFRKKSAKSAAMRAELMMRGGTSGGLLWNSLRNAGINIALRTPLSSVMDGMFTMLSLPNRDLQSCLSRVGRDLGWRK